MTITTNMQDRLAARKATKAQQWAAFHAYHDARKARGEYVPGDQANGYVLTEYGQWVPIQMVQMVKNRSQNVTVAVTTFLAFDLLLFVIYMSSIPTFPTP